MLDLKFVRRHQDKVEQPLKTRGLTVSLDEFNDIDQKRRRRLSQVEMLRETRNTLSEEVGKRKKAKAEEGTGELIAKVKQINDHIKTLAVQVAEYDTWVRDFLLVMPNLPHDSVPVGASSEDNPVVRTWGEPPSFDFEARPHWESGEKLGILDFERAAKITGARFALLKGAGALMERALINFM